MIEVKVEIEIDPKTEPVEVEVEENKKGFLKSESLLQIIHSKKLLKIQIFEANKKLIPEFTIVNEDFNFAVER